jgi:hypothetical protein
MSEIALPCLPTNRMAPSLVVYKVIRNAHDPASVLFIIIIIII